VLSNSPIGRTPQTPQRAAGRRVQKIPEMLCHRMARWQLLNLKQLAERHQHQVTASV